MFAHYIIKCKTRTRKGKKRQYNYTDYTTAKEMYVSFTYNVNIKSAKLYEIYNGKKELLEKFKNYEKIGIL